MPLYRDGSLSLTKGQKKVSGAGTAWGINAAPGDLLIVEGLYYEIISIESDTELTLDSPADASYAGPYLIVRSISTANNLYLMRKIEQFLRDRQATLGQLEAMIPELEQVLLDAQNKLAQMGDLGSYVGQALAAKDTVLVARNDVLDAKKVVLDAKDMANSAKDSALNSAGAAAASESAARASRTASASSATSADASRVAAETAQNATAASERNALDSASAAQASKSAAVTSEAAAKVSQVAAASSETVARDAKNAASQSEAAALASKNAAALSASEATDAEGRASASAAAALASEAAAATSETHANAAKDASAASAAAAAKSAADAAAVASGELINDASNAPNRTWSSQKISQQLSGKLDSTATAVNAAKFSGESLERFPLFNAVNPKTLTLHSPQSGAGWQYTALEIREAMGVLDKQSSDDYAPRLTFHWGNRVARPLSMRADGNLYWDEWQLIHSGNGRTALLEKPSQQTLEYDAAGRLASIIENVAGASKKTVLTYNADGTLQRSVETLGNRTRTETFTYNGGRLSASVINEVKN